MWGCCCCLVVAPAGAATLKWEQERGTESCAGQAHFVEAVEARLDRPVADYQKGLAEIQIRTRRAGTSWVAEIEIRSATTPQAGLRVLKVDGATCDNLEQYAALAVALILSPDPVPPASSEGVALAPGGDEEAAGPPAAMALGHEKMDEVATGEPTRDGTGPYVVYLYPTLLSDDRTPRLASSVPPDWLRLGLERAVTDRLLARETLSLVHTKANFSTVPSARSWARRASIRPAPRIAQFPPADYALVPELEELLVQDGVDYTMGDRPQAVVVSGKVRVLVVDFKNHRTLGDITAQTSLSLSVAGKSRNTAAQTAAGLVLGRLADETANALRAYAAFRIRPRFVEAEREARLASLRGVSDGDAFQFEDASGERSGYVVLDHVGASRASAVVRKSGSGERLVELSAFEPTSNEVYLYSGARVAYSEPKAVASPPTSGALGRSPQLGDRREYGLGLRLLHLLSPVSPVRVIGGVRGALITGSSLGFVSEGQLGLGYELPVLPAVGLTLTPYAAPGVLFMRADFGMAALSASAGVQAELYRLVGDFSLTFGVEAQYSGVVWAETPKNQFIDERYPNLSGLSLQLGLRHRPATHRD